MPSQTSRQNSSSRNSSARRESSKGESDGVKLSLAKLTPPSLPRLVARPHLIEQIDHLRETGTKVVWIQAPPGAGKTTLVASYVLTTKRPSLWYQFNAGDADPATWFYYLTLGIQQAAPRFRKPMLALEAAYLPDLAGFTRQFFEQFFTRLKSPSLVIFDNYHDLPKESPIHSLIVEAFRTVPPGVCCLVTSRHAPPPSLASLLADQTLTEFSANALAFNLVETHKLLRLHHPQYSEATSLEWAKQLHAKTKGWVVGLILLGGNSPPVSANDLKELVPQRDGLAEAPVLVDYFSHEALAGLTQTVRTLFLKTATFPSFTASMAYQMTGCSQIGYELNKLVRARYFIESRKGEKTVFQYHRLFKEFLCQYGEQELGSGVWQALQTKAAGILVEEGWIEEAIQLYFDSGQTVGATALILQQAQELMTQGRFQTLANWLARLPSEEFQREPYLMYWHGMSELLCNPNKSLQLLEGVYDLFEVRGDRGGMFLAASGVVHAIELSWMRFDRLDHWISTIESLWNSHASSVLPTVQSTVIIAMIHGLFWRQPQQSSMQTWISRVEALLPEFDQLQELPLLAHHLIHCSAWFGNFQQGLRVAAMIAKRIESIHLSPPSQYMWSIAQSVVSWLRGDIHSAKIHVQQGIELIEQWGGNAYVGLFLSVGLQLALDTQDPEYGEALIAKVNHAVPHMGPLFEMGIMGQSGFFKALRGDMAQARQQVLQAEVLAQNIKGMYVEAISIVGSIFILLVTSQLEESRERLRRVVELSSSMQHYPLKFYCHLLKAYEAFITSDRTRGLQELRYGLELGRRHGIFHSLEPWLPHILTPLCAVAIQEEIETDYVRQLIRAKRLTLDVRTADTLDWPWSIHVQTLGPFIITTENGLLTFGRKAPLTPMRLLKLLISLGGQNISLTRLADGLWPDSDGDAAYRSTLTNLARLRKLLGGKDILIVKGGLLSLNTHLCWVDSLAFEHLAHEALSRIRTGERTEAEIFADRALQIHQGQFLESEDDLIDIVTKREQLSNLFMELKRCFSK